MRNSLAALCLAVGLFAVAGCTTATGDEETALVGAPEPDDADLFGAESVSATLAAGTELKTNAALNLRSSPSTSAGILGVIPDNTTVTVVNGTPKSGWYNIKWGSKTGWSYGVYLDKVASSGGGGGVSTGTGSCDPARAIGIVSSKRKALLDTIAFAEGTRGYAQDGYNVTFAYHTFSSCDRHPGVRYCSGSYCSDASGRYQFLSSTWKGLGLSNFRPENQTIGAMTLISRRGGTVPADRAMSATEFSNLMSKISWEWASLPPGRYGQPMKSMSTLRSQYCKFAGC